MIAEKIPELKNLSPEDKLILVGELWDELAAHPDAFPPREDHIITSPKKLPKLDEPRKEAAPSPQPSSGGEIVTPKPLPRLNAPKKKPDEPPPA